MIVFGLDIRKIEYNYRVDGPKDLKKGLLFDKERYLLDPYAKAVTGQSNWGEKPEYSRDCYRARVVSNDFAGEEPGENPQICGTLSSMNFIPEDLQNTIHQM